MSDALAFSKESRLRELANEFIKGQLGHVPFLDAVKGCASTAGEAMAVYNEAILRRDRRLANQLGLASSGPASASGGLLFGGAGGGGPSAAGGHNPDDPVGDDQENRDEEDPLQGEPDDPTAAPPTGQGEAIGGNDSDPARLAVDEIGWALLAARAREADRTERRSHQPLSEILGLFNPPRSSSTTTLLSGAPFLSKLSDSSGDPHIDETYRLRRHYSTEKLCDELLDLVQKQLLKNSLPREIWREIILDRTVAFDKLHAALDSRYEWNDEPKDFGGGFALVRKDQIISRKPVRLESEWCRVFDVWSSSVSIVYPHRLGELTHYRELVMELFRASIDDPSLAIKFDVEVRDKYAKCPFRLDSREQLHVPLLNQLVAATRSVGSSFKRSGGVLQSSAKRPQVVCENWNLGKCAETPCRNRRRHGSCSECGGDHAAKDVAACATKLRARRPQPYGEGPGRTSAKNQVAG